MKSTAWRALLVNAVQHNDTAQLDAIAARLAADERLAIALGAHGHPLNGQAIDVVVCRALNMKVLTLDLGMTVAHVEVGANPVPMPQLRRRTW